MSRQCKEGLILTYLKYVKNQESPQIFHVWSILTVISAILRRSVWMDRGYYTLFPNLFTVLVSPSGVGRKGTAMKLAVELVDNSSIPLNSVRGKITATRIVSRLAKSAAKEGTDGVASLFIYSEEFKVFTKGVMKDSSIVEDLTQLYDNGMFDYETEHGQQERLKKPIVTILAGSTPEWLSGGSAGDLLSGGFGARLVPVSVIRNEKNEAWPEKGELERALEISLIADLEEIAHLTGQFHVTADAKKLFRLWYDRREEQKLFDERLAGYFSKKHDLVLKISMLLAVAMDDEMAIQQKHIEGALGLLARIEETIIFAYSGAVYGQEAKHTEKAYSGILAAGEEGIAHSSLMRQLSFHMGAKQLREAIEVLVTAGKVVRKEIRTETKPKLVYVAIKGKEEE